MNGVSWRRAPRIAVDTARVWYQAAKYLAAAWTPRAVSRFTRSGAPHIALLARHLPPIITGGVYRPLALMNEAARRGWRITALSGPAPGAPSAAGIELRNRFPESARLVNWQWSTLDVSQRMSPSLDGGFTTIHAIVDAALGAAGEDAPDLVHATGPTFAEFVAAMVLARHWRVPFSIDYRDEWSESPFEFVHHGNSDRFWEAKVLARASLVTFTTDAQRDHALRAFPSLDRGITAVVGNGWDEESARNAGHHHGDATSDRAVVGYLGSLGQHCDVPEFLATLRGALAIHADLKHRIEIDFVGIKSDVERRLLSSFDAGNKVLRDVPQVPLSAAQAMMRTSNALLLFNPPLLARYIPGKAYEYIATGNRILLYGEGGELERLLADYPAAIRVHRGDSRGLSEALRTIASANGGGRADPTLVARYSRLRRAAEHADMLQRLISASRESGAASPQPA